MKIFNSLILLFLVILLRTPGLLYAQTPGIEWQKCLGGTGGDVAQSIISTPDGGYFFGGFTSSTDGDVSGTHGDDAWMVKLNASGNIEWQKCFGGSGIDGAESVINTFDGGYAFAGSTRSSDGDAIGWHGGGINSSDAWVVKLSSSGNIEWQKCLGGTKTEQANSLVQTYDGGFVIAGTCLSTDGDVSGFHGGSGADAWVVKLDSLGNIKWQRCLGGTGDDVAYSIIQTSDKGLALCGYTWSNDGDVSGNHGAMDAWVVKLDSAGNIEWQKCLGGSIQEWFQCIIQDADHGFTCAGYTGSQDGDVSGLHTGGYYDAWVVKLDSTGNLSWQKCVGGKGDDLLNSIAHTKDGGYIAAGSTTSNDEGFFNHGSWDEWVIKLNSEGDFQWQKCLGGKEGDEVAYSIIEVSANEYVIAGETNSSDGDVTGQHGGATFNGYPYGDAWIVKLGDASNVQTTTTSSQLSLSTYPNPAAKNITLSYDLPKVSQVGITIYNVTGERMKEIQQPQEESGHHEASLDLSGYPDGTYFISVAACGMTEREMVQLIK